MKVQQAERPPGLEPVPKRRLQRETSFRGDVARLVSGTTAAQGISILASPLLARLYAPEAFGLATLFASVTSIVGVIACLRYEYSIVLPKEDADAANLLGVSLLFPLAVAALTAFVLALGGESLLELVNGLELKPFLWLVPIAVFFSGVLNALNYWNTRTKQFGRLSFNRVAVTSVTTLITLGAGIVGYATGGTKIVASVLGTLSAASLLGGQIWRSNGAFLRESIQWRKMIYGIKRYRKFPLVSTWSAFLNTASLQLPPLIMIAFFSSTVVGYYALSLRLVRLPMHLVGSSIAQVFFQRASEAQTEGTLSILVEKILSWLVIIGMPPLLTLTIIGRELFIVVFGVGWGEAGVYSQILSILIFFQFIYSPLSTLEIILERQEIEVIRNIVLLITTTISLGVGGVVGDMRIGLILLAVSGSIIYVSIMLFFTKLIGVSPLRSLHIIFSCGIRWLPIGIILLILQTLEVHLIILLISAGALAVIYYLAVFRSHLTSFGLMPHAKN